MKKLSLTSTLLTALTAAALADHGPGTSGGGFNTQTAEILKQRQWSAALSSDWTEFDSPAENALVGKEHFDLIDRSFLTNLGLSLGLTENFQLGLSFGYYAAQGSRRIAHHHDEAATTGHEEHGAAEPAAHAEAPGAEHLEAGGHHDQEPAADDHPPATQPQLASFDPDGWTDLWLNAKYRVYRGAVGQVALLGGVKFPVGEDRVIDSLGERVEPAATPGSGAWDGMVGAAYSLALAPALHLDASAQYTLRGEQHDYRLGNRIDAGLAMNWRIAGDAKRFPQFVLVGEATVRSVAKSKEGGERDGNTGGTALFLSPGLRVGFCENASWSVGVQIPVLQELNGDQVQTKYRLTTGLNLAF